jgi:hypothetical protein
VGEVVRCPSALLLDSRPHQSGRERENERERNRERERKKERERKRERPMTLLTPQLVTVRRRRVKENNDRSRATI